MPTTNDGTDEPDGTITARILSGAGYGVGEPGRALVTVSDDDSPGGGDEVEDDDGGGGGGGGVPPIVQPVIPIIAIEADTSPVSEGNDADFIVTATPAPSRAIDVVVDVSGGEGFTVISGNQMVRLDAGERTATLTIATIDDFVDEHDDDITATLLSRSGYRISPSDGSATVTVTDDDTAGVTVAVADPLVVQEGGSNGYSVVLDTQPDSTVAIGLSISGSDNQDVIANPVSLTFTPDNWNTPQSVTVNAQEDDDTADDSAVITHAATSSDPHYDGIPVASVAVTVEDDDVATGDGITVSIESVAPSITEGENAGFVVRASPAVAEDLAVAVNVSGGSAFGVTDGDRMVTILAGSDSAELSLSTIDDSVDEPDGTITARILNGAGSALVTVTDNDVAGATPIPDSVSVIDYDIEVSIEAMAATINEGENAWFVVRASRAVAEDLAVSVNVSGGNAFGVMDGDRMVTIPAGSDSAELSMSTVDDSADEPNGTIMARIMRGSVPGAGDLDSASVAVMDDDGSGREGGGVHPIVLPTIAIEADTSPVTEGIDARYTITATPAPSQAFDVVVNVSGGAGFTAVSGNQMVRLDAGKATTKLTLATINDFVDEHDDDITATLLPLSQYRISPSDRSAAVTVTDDDTAGVTVSKARLSLTEGHSQNASDTYTIVLNTQPTGNVVISLDVTGDPDVTADAATLTFTPQNWDQEQTVTVSAAQDDDTADDSAVITHAATSADPHYEGIPVPSVAVTVEDGRPRGHRRWHHGLHRGNGRVHNRGGERRVHHPGKPGRGGSSRSYGQCLRRRSFWGGGGRPDGDHPFRLGFCGAFPVHR